jgi:hypothetical protein
MPANAEPSQVGMTGNVSWDFLIMVRLKNFQDRLPPELKDASNFRSHERQGSTFEETDSRKTFMRDRVRFVLPFAPFCEMKVFFICS